ncbi:Transmembrane protein 104 [Seminavis robusta]|uniref:Transmembrane protein 104 n=1 Tax=Seminavis robusta TaxID=568900 RepID=A0A9N8EGU2_9STRA|nr:Transmembrane protein 104 [Seminavis robusta]|eukprot:Sro1180_g249730.1 Transmembrane protein 104 (601) ;mRNA; f:17649-19549
MFHHEVEESGEKPDDASEAATVPPSSPSIAASPYWGQSTAPAKPEGFSPAVGFCFAINYILGTGFLTVPWAFSQGGLVLSTVVIIAVGFFSDMAKNYLLETMARAEAMLDNRMHWIKRQPGDEEKMRLIYSPVIMRTESSDLLQSTPKPHNYDSTGNLSAHGGKLAPAYSLPGTPGASLPGTPLPSQPGTPSKQQHGRHLIHRPPPKYLVKHRKFEVNSLCRVFLGKPGLRLYTAFICLYIYCTLWAYTSVFASAIANAVPILGDDNYDTNYLIFALIFAAMVVPMSCMELDEQVVVQVIMTGARFLMLALMVGTSSLCADDVHNHSKKTFEEAPMFHLAGIHKMLPIMVFAHIYHHSIPGLANPVNNKKSLSGMFRATTTFSTIAYAFIGIVLASTFGKHIEQSSNLNWNNFTGGTAVLNKEGEIVSVAWWAKAISIYVLCFPALDVVSAFPLNAITLGNNMMGSYYGKRIHEVEHNRWIRIRFRLLAGIPPIIFGILERQLGTITDYAGTTGFMIGFSFPALLYLRSRMKAKKKHFNATTFYSSYASSSVAAWALFYFGAVMVVYVVCCLVTRMGDEDDDERRRGRSLMFVGPDWLLQ